jgi:hypothetical protein
MTLSSCGATERGMMWSTLSWSPAYGPRLTVAALPWRISGRPSASRQPSFSAMSRLRRSDSLVNRAAWGFIFPANAWSSRAAGSRPPALATASQCTAFCTLGLAPRSPRVASLAGSSRAPNRLTSTSAPVNGSASSVSRVIRRDLTTASRYRTSTPALVIPAHTPETKSNPDPRRRCEVCEDSGSSALRTLRDLRLRRLHGPNLDPTTAPAPAQNLDPSPRDERQHEPRV